MFRQLVKCVNYGAICQWNGLDGCAAVGASINLKCTIPVQIFIAGSF